MLAGATRGESDWMLILEDCKLVCRFKLVVDMVGGGIRQFVNDTEGPAFLERELIKLSMDRYW
jgi:hypothetical protein